MPIVNRTYVESILKATYSTAAFGGCSRIRTANVYHEGGDLQSPDAHALASKHPLI